jgi:hypothetical protein
MDKIPTTIEVRDQAKRLVALLEDPHPGLATWIQARNDATVQLYKMLGEVLGKMIELTNL